MRIIKQCDLTLYNSYRIASRCREAYFPETEADIVRFFSDPAPYCLLGSGHNVILSRDWYDTRFLIFNGNFNALEGNPETGEIVAESGISMLEISEQALELGLSGMEIFYDIPSSLGGAVVMNAGASGEEIKDVLVKVRYLDLADRQVKEIRQEDMGFEYRNSFFQRHTDKVVLKVWLRLRPADKAAIRAKMDRIRDQRWAKQPRNYPNAGSVFKRPKGHYVGALMDELGLKGYTVGGAQISEKHGGFIVNVANASGQDILEIIAHVKNKVKERYDVELEVEQRII
ncbi:UDP-N-acetylmuramate dehydrogenase [Cyclobacterium sp. SYSU L10401]|uniref:UDP-N-acetylmuramate dehydrogenase n=1 Tax=Cyclobacterium sp. SYSU L10401 TaxID=2678657 RepID=UPI0013D7F337|nr:UDP-N-acetylmuramate dehydrogenase [Cyclobacterium sp. SYSU L10401]